EMCASTMCPLSSLTRNMALGRGSITEPSTSIASSLAKTASSAWISALRSSAGNYHNRRTGCQPRNEVSVPEVEQPFCHFQQPGGLHRLGDVLVGAQRQRPLPVFLGPF